MRRTVSIISAGLAGLSLAFCAACSSGDAEADSARTVLYKASGVADRGTVFLEDGGEKLRQLADVPLPLVDSASGSTGVQASLRPGDIAIMSVTPTTRGLTVECSIEIDGAVVSSNSKPRDASGEVLCTYTVK